MPTTETVPLLTYRNFFRVPAVIAAVDEYFRLSIVKRSGDPELEAAHAEVESLAKFYGCEKYWL